MWAFGVVIWEIATMGSRDPYYDYATSKKIFKEFSMGVDGLTIELYVGSGGQLVFPESCLSEWVELVTKKCWVLKPKERPSFSTIVASY